MAGKPRNKHTIIVSENVADEIIPGEGIAILSFDNLATAIEALDRISTIHDHPGSCSKNCPALIAKEALRKIRNGQR